MVSLSVSPQGHNIFSNLSSKEYGDLMQLLKQSILATDLTLYFEYVLLLLNLLIVRWLLADSNTLTHLQWSIYCRCTMPTSGLFEVILPPRGFYVTYTFIYKCLVSFQEQKHLLWARQQRRVQLESEGSSRHVQVMPCSHRHGSSLSLWILWEINVWFLSDPWWWQRVILVPSQNRGKYHARWENYHIYEMHVFLWTLHLEENNWWINW